MRPMSPRDRSRSGPQPASALMGRAAASAARSVCWIAHVFGATSATTKNRVTLRTVAPTTPQPPNSRLASTPSSVDCTSCVDSTTSSVGLSHSWSSTSDSSTSPRLPLVSARAWALACDTRVRAVSATARTIDSRNSSTTAATIDPVGS